MLEVGLPVAIVIDRPLWTRVVADDAVRGGGPSWRGRKAWVGHPWV